MVRRMVQSLHVMLDKDGWLLGVHEGNNGWRRRHEGLKIVGWLRLIQGENEALQNTKRNN